MMPLCLAQIGEETMIRRITGKQQVRRHLEELGFVAGSSVTLVSRIAGNVIVHIKESRVAISEELARKIMVDE